VAITEKGLAVFEENNPYNLLMKCVDVINEHTEMINDLGEEIIQQERILAELVKQNTQMLKNLKTMNAHIKLINQRLSNLESQNATKQTTTNDSE
jgi:uncharacterized coiled-coil protein SlyX